MSTPIITTQNIPAEPVSYRQMYQVLARQCAAITAAGLVVDGDGWIFTQSDKEWSIHPTSTTLATNGEVTWAVQDGELSADDQYILEALVASLVACRRQL